MVTDLMCSSLSPTRVEVWWNVINYRGSGENFKIAYYQISAGSKGSGKQSCLKPGSGWHIGSWF